MSEELDPKWSVERAVLAAKMPHPSKLVMLVMLSHLHHPRELYLNGSSPSLRKLAAETGMVYASVRKHVRLLEANGWLVPHKQPKGKRSQYELSTGRSFSESSTSSLPSESGDSSLPQGESGDDSLVSQEMAQSESADSSRIEERTQDQEIFSSGGKPGKRRLPTGIVMSGPAPWDQVYLESDPPRQELEAYDMTPLRAQEPAPDPDSWEALYAEAGLTDSPDEFDFEQLLNDPLAR